MVKLKRVSALLARRLLLESKHNDPPLYATYNGIRPSDWIESVITGTGRVYGRLFPCLDNERMIAYIRSKNGWFAITARKGSGELCARNAKPTMKEGPL